MLKSNIRRIIVPLIAVLTLAITLAVVISSHIKHPTFNAESGIRISSVAHPYFFFPLGKGQVCLAAIWMAVGSGKLWSRAFLLIVMVCIWSWLNDYYAAESKQMWAAIYMITASFIYGGLLTLRARMAFQPPVASNHRQFSIRHILFATTWIATLLMLEQHQVGRIGFKPVLMSYLSLAIPPAFMSLLLFWVIMGAATARLIYRVPIAVGVGVAFTALVDVSVAFIHYLEHGRWFPHLFDNIPLSCLRIAIIGFLISIWLVAVRVSRKPAVS